ncbi:transcription termination factor MTEF18, mitochondrial [Apium graveolens]|uniref:transcription termination factor MTEF18, mitochondrial n=1 Tax=Apium graveolens TaxID=4045 RepID=UPI003D797326
MQSLSFSTISRYFSSSSLTPKLLKLKTLYKIPAKDRPKAFQQAQKVLTDYLHDTKNLPFTFADHISKNSLLSLSEIISKVDYSSKDFKGSLRRFLRYHPIDEFLFFYESIGVRYDNIIGFLPVGKMFLSEDYRVFDVACGLWGFGFPWDKLGVLCKEGVFENDLCELNERIVGFKEYGFSNVMVIGICLAFPCLLSGKCEDIDGLFDDLKRVFVDYHLVSCVEENVDCWFEVCRKIQIFYDLGCVKGEMGEMMGRCKNIFVEYSEECLVQKAEFFKKLDVCKKEVGYLLLYKPEILRCDLETPSISVSGVLRYFGLEESKLRFVMENYPYVFGRNRLSNLPHVMRSLDLNKWFFYKIQDGDHNLLGRYVVGSPDEDLDQHYVDNFLSIQGSRYHVHTLGKLEFLHSLGFGENKWTIKILNQIRGPSSDLQERVDCLLQCGVEFPKLCKMIHCSPKILNQQKESIEQKIKYLCEDIGHSLEDLDVFPAYLCYNLEKRIKPRYSFHMWLTKHGLCTEEYAIPSIIATSEKNFVLRIYRMHRAAPKIWLECYSNKEPRKSLGEGLIKLEP